MDALHWADWGILFVVGLSGLMSLRRGIVKEALSLVIWVVAVFVSATFATSLEIQMLEGIESPALRRAAAYSLLFVLTLVLGGMINFLLASLVRATGLTGTDRFLGMFFGVARGILVVLVGLLVLFQLIPEQSDEWTRDSVFVPYVLMLEDWVVELAQQLYGLAQDMFSK